MTSRGCDISPQSLFDFDLISIYLLSPGICYVVPDKITRSARTALAI